MLRPALLSLLVLSSACAEMAQGPLAPSAPAASSARAKASPDPTATFKFPLDHALLALKGDGLYSDGANSVYTNGVCGVTAKVFVGGSGDATMQTNSPRASDRQCRDYPRKMTLAYDDGVSETIAVFMNLHELQSATFSIPVGATAKREFAINPTQTTRCDRLTWSSGIQGAAIAADSVLVTRVDASTWTVETQPYPNDRAYCTTNGQSYHMRLKFTVVSSRALAG